MHQTLNLSTVTAGGYPGLGGDQGQRVTKFPHTHTCAGKETNSLIFFSHPFGKGRKAAAKGARCDHSAGYAGYSLTTPRHCKVEQGAVGWLCSNQEKCLRRGWETGSEAARSFCCLPVQTPE